MKLLTLPTPVHGGEIHSVDIDGDNTRVLTAGKDGSVAVWDYAQLQDCLKTNNFDIKPTTTYLHHGTAVVRLAKWSPADATVFVSCDEAGYVFLTTKEGLQQVYPLAGGSGSTAPDGAEKESSTTPQPASVTDGSWNAAGTLFAWATSDGALHLIDTHRLTYQELSSLDHSDKPLVPRSVAFDPSDNYLVTVNDDTLVNLYQYHHQELGYQFRLISKISKLINKTPVNVNYKRISWSADGEFISVPTASKNLTSVVSLLSRSNGWTNKVSLVGHDLCCEVVRFGPKIYSTDEAGAGEPANAYHIVATAGSDRSLVVWNTAKDLPLFVVRDVSPRPVVDLAWARDGAALLLASLDGRLTALTFEPGELGHPVNDDTWRQLQGFKEKFVKPFTFKYEDGPAKKGAGAAIELLDQKDAVPVFKPADADVDAPAAPAVPAEPEKIVPAHLGVIAPEVLPVAPEDDILHTMVTRSKKTRAQAAKAAPKTAAEPKTAAKPAAAASYGAQKITSKDGKKRIQPMLISKATSDTPTAFQSSSPAATSTATKSLMEFDKPSYLVTEEVFREKRRLRGLQDDTSTKKLKRDLEPVKFIGSIVVNPNLAFSRTRLAIPKVRISFRNPSRLDGDGELFSLDIRNGQGNEATPTRITYLKKDKQIWCDFIPRYIQLVAEGATLWALSTTDGQIITYSRNSGKRLLPPLVLGTPISFLECHGNYLMAVTSVGELYVWDVEARKLHLNSPLSLSPLLDLSNKYQEDGLSKSENLTMCSITSKGIPLVTLSNGSGYLYNKDLGTWQTITESWWAFGSHYWDSLNDDSAPQTTGLLGNDGASLIKLLEHKTNEEIIRKTRTDRGKYFNKISKNMVMKEGFENLENTISLSHLENRILCCELLGETPDFKRFLITYAKRICELGHKAKLYDICSQLLGPVIENDDDEDEIKLVEDSDWDPKICGLEKRALLKEIILSCASNRDAQRVLIHFGKRIGVLENLD